MKKSKQQESVHYLDDTINKAIIYTFSNYRYIAILIYLLCFLEIGFMA